MSFEGKWDISIASPMGQQLVSLAIGREGGELAGTATQGAETVPFKNIQADGDRLRWTQNVSRPFPLTVKFDVTMAGDTMSGTAKAGLFPETKLTGQRV